MGKKKRAGGLRAKRTYKDTLFRMLFREKENLLSLYNAVNGTAYSNPEALKVVTLENAVYMNMKNDLAFILDCGLNLYEHQASINPNMPLRDLFYLSREYQALVSDSTLYSRQLVKVPTPNFIVFYNGTEEVEERKILKLSDAFEKSTESPNLELFVTQLNINSGYNEDIQEACQTLREYMQFVNRVRTYAEYMELNEAVERAVDECIQEGILREFLMKNRAEAIEVCIFEYDEVKEQKRIREAEYLAGEASGYSKGIECARKVFKLAAAGVAVSEIAEKVGITESEVNQILNE